MYLQEHCNGQNVFGNACGSLFTVYEMTMQGLHGLFTVCEMTVQGLHGVVAVCEMIMQGLHGLFTVCEMILKHQKESPAG